MGVRAQRRRQLLALEYDVEAWGRRPRGSIRPTPSPARPDSTVACNPLRVDVDRAPIRRRLVRRAPRRRRDVPPLRDPRRPPRLLRAPQSPDLTSQFGPSLHFLEANAERQAAASCRTNSTANSPSPNPARHLASPASLLVAGSAIDRRPAFESGSMAHATGRNACCRSNPTGARPEKWGRDRPIARRGDARLLAARRRPRSALRPRVGSVRKPHADDARIAGLLGAIEVPYPTSSSVKDSQTRGLGRPWGFKSAFQAGRSLTRSFADNRGGSSRRRSYPHALSRGNTV